MIFYLIKKFLRIFSKGHKRRKFRQNVDLANKQKGDKYELQICSLYSRKGYKVYPNGAINGVADGGIDLIAYKGNEAILIQCKNWEYSQVRQEHLRIFLGDCTAYLEKIATFLQRKMSTVCLSQAVQIKTMAWSGL